MGFIVDSLANIFLETLDTLILWICNLTCDFSLDIGKKTSTFHKIFLRTETAEDAFSGFAFGIGSLAMMIVILVTILKIYQLMADPFARAESPGSIFLRFIFAGTGVITSYRLFRYFEKGFNKAYKLFTNPYKTITNAVKQRNQDILERMEDASAAREASGAAWEGRRDGGGGHQQGDVNAGDAFIFGQDKLINPDDGLMDHPTAVAIVELVVGGALFITLIRLIFEIYERYIIIAVLYILSPLAFAMIISKQSAVFKNYLIMVASQFVLMCTNLIFLGIFMQAWYDILVTDNPYFFEDSQDFVTTMFLMIGWLIAGQKLDEHMRTLGLSAAQTGQGIMGAVLGSMFMARAAVGSALGVAGGVLGGTGQALTGQTGVQKAWNEGIESNGQRGGLLGKFANWQANDGTQRGASDVNQTVSAAGSGSSTSQSTQATNNTGDVNTTSSQNNTGSASSSSSQNTNSTGGSNTFTGGEYFSDNMKALASSENMNLTSAQSATIGNDEGSLSLYNSEVNGEAGKGIAIANDAGGEKFLRENYSQDQLREVGTGIDGATKLAAVYDAGSSPVNIENNMHIRDSKSVGIQMANDGRIRNKNTIRSAEEKAWT